MDQEAKLKKILPEKEPEVIGHNGYKIPVCSPWFNGNEMRYLQEAIQGGWISGNGDFIDKFEKEFAKKTGASYAVSCNSGTSALHLGYRLIGIKPGDEVIVPTFTMISTATPLIEMGAVPVFVDCDKYGQIDATKIEAKITPKTKAIAAVHIYGHPVDIDAIQKIAIDHNLRVLYDAAEAHGAKWNGNLLGKYGDVVCYSFYANKVLTTGEGGMVTTNYPDHNRKAKRLIDEYFSYERHFWHEDYGYSYRMSNLLAAIGLGQTEKLHELIDLRRKHADQYTELLADVPGITPLPENPKVTSIRWMYGILVDPEKFGMTRNELRVELGKRGVETRTFFIPLHLQPVMQRFNPPQDEFPVAEQWCEQGMYLPSGSGLSGWAIEATANHIWRVYETSKGKGTTGGVGSGGDSTK